MSPKTAKQGPQTQIWGITDKGKPLDMAPRHLLRLFKHLPRLGIKDMPSITTLSDMLLLCSNIIAGQTMDTLLNNINISVPCMRSHHILALRTCANHITQNPNITLAHSLEFEEFEEFDLYMMSLCHARVDCWCLHGPKLFGIADWEEWTDIGTLQTQSTKPHTTMNCSMVMLYWHLCAYL